MPAAAETVTQQFCFRESSVCAAHIYEGLPGFIKIFPSISHSTGHTKTLPQ